jgi:hypothetical protein
MQQEIEGLTQRQFDGGVHEGAMGLEDRSMKGVGGVAGNLWYHTR